MGTLLLKQLTLNSCFHVKTEINKTHCYVLENLKYVTPDPQTKLIIIHCGTNNIAKCNNVDDALALIQENLTALKEKLPQSTQLIYSMIVGRGDEVDQKRKEFNAHMLLFCNKHNIFICDHTNLLQRDEITPRFFIQDKVHLSVEKNKVFSANLSYPLRMALKILVIPRRSTTPPRRLSWGPKRGFRPNKGYGEHNNNYSIGFNTFDDKR